LITSGIIPLCLAKSSLSTNYLKSAIEKKLSKEYKAQMSATGVKSDSQSMPVKSNPADSKNIKTSKDPNKPVDVKVNYNVLLKNRETPPPRKREEAKKTTDSSQKKALSKSSVINTKSTTESGPQYSSYLNNLFSTSFAHLNSATPSAYSSNYANVEKKTPISTKATPLTYNLTLSQKAQTLTRPQRTNTAQISEKGYNSNSMLGSTLNKSKLVYTNETPSTTNLTTKYNNYMAQSKPNPVRVTYEKIERPHSATPDRSATPQGGLRRVGTPVTVGFSASTAQQNSSQGLSAQAKNGKHSKKDSGSQELLAKSRQRSSSPSQMGYNPVLSSSMNLKNKAKY